MYSLCFYINIVHSRLNSKYLKDLPNSDNWNLDKGYLDNSELDTYPRRALGSGKRSGLTVLMRAYNKDLDYLCRGAVQGFKVCQFCN